jgi:hypothetical protein
MNPTVHLFIRNSISHQPHNDAQSLHISIPAFIVEEQHLLVRQPRNLLHLLKMAHLAAGIYLQMIEELYRSSVRWRFRGWRVRVEGGMRGNLEELEHLSGEVWSICSRRGADFDLEVSQLYS